VKDIAQAIERSRAIVCANAFTFDYRLAAARKITPLEASIVSPEGTWKHSARLYRATSVRLNELSVVIVEKR